MTYRSKTGRSCKFIKYESVENITKCLLDEKESQNPNSLSPILYRNLIIPSKEFKSTLEWTKQHCVWPCSIAAGVTGPVISLYSILAHWMTTLIAPPAPVRAVSNASMVCSSVKWWVIIGLTSTTPDATIASAVGYLKDKYKNILVWLK